MRRHLMAFAAGFALTAALIVTNTTDSAGQPPPQNPATSHTRPSPALSGTATSTSTPGTAHGHTAPQTTAPTTAAVASSTTAVTAPPVAAPTPPTGSVETTIRAAAAEFGVSGDLLVRIARCESNLRPDAVNRSSGALGLFQHLPRYWGARAAALGYGYDSWSDPTANARVSAKLLADGGPGHWRACL